MPCHASFPWFIPWPISATAWDSYPEWKFDLWKTLFQFNLTHDKTAVWPMTKSIFLLNLWQKCSLTYDKSTVGPVTKLHIDLWQKCGPTKLQFELWLNYALAYMYDRPTVLSMTPLATVWGLRLMTNKQTFTCDKNAVWPVTNSLIKLWQKHTLTYDTTITTIQTR